jgi:hydroxypyruvate isomerase
LRVSVCIEWLFAEAGTFPDRVRAAADAGLTAVEFWKWREENGHGSDDLEGIRSAAEERGVDVVAICTAPFVDLGDSRTHLAYLAGMERSVEAAKRVGASNLITQCGDFSEDIPYAQQEQNLIIGLQRAGDIAGRHGLSLLIEPMNRTEHPRQLLSDTAVASRVLGSVNLPQVRLLYDRYHSMLMGELAGYGLPEEISQVGHYHLADPGRHIPGTRGVDWEAELLAVLNRGYQGYFGLEYKPRELDSATATRGIVDLVARLTSGI